MIFQDWTLSFMFPSLIVACVGFLVFLFLVPKPSHVGLTFDKEGKVDVLEGEMTEDELNSVKKDDGGKGKAISFHRAFMIPGVIEFSLCLFSAKLVFYVFLFWLPHYIKVATPSTTSTSYQNTFPHCW